MRRRTSGRNGARSGTQGGEMKNLNKEADKWRTNGRHGARSGTESRKDIKEVNKKIISNTGFSVKSSNNRCLETLELNEVNNMIKSYLA